MANRKRVTYTVRQKRNVIKTVSQGTSIRKTSLDFDIPRSNVIRWCNESNVYVKKHKNLTRFTRRVVSTTSDGRQSLGQNSECEKLVFEWFKEQRRQKLGVGTLSIRNKMNMVMEELSPENQIKASGSWLQRFMSRFDLSLRRISGSGKSFPENLQEIVKNYLYNLHEVINQEEYKEHQIFNIDESCFRMDCPGSYTVSIKGANKTYAKSTGREKVK